MKRTLRVGIVVATLLTGFVYQHAVVHSGTPHPLPRLRTLPLVMGPWQGAADALPPEIVAVLRPDDYILRSYRTSNAGPGVPITVYIAYYAHPALNGRIHSPNACLPGGGWLPVEAGRQQIAIPGAPSDPIAVNRYLVQRGADRGLVLYWFQGRGRTVASEVQASLLLAYDALRGRGSDEMLVRISAPVRGVPGMTLGEEIRFVQRFYPQLRHVLAGG